jgi:hypothetical protein
MQMGIEDFDTLLRAGIDRYRREEGKRSQQERADLHVPASLKFRDGPTLTDP